MEIAFVLILLLLVIVLLATEKISVDLVAIGMLLALLFSGVITPREAFSGFSDDLTILLASIFIISAALKEHGVLEWLCGNLVKLAQRRPSLLLPSSMTAVSLMSAFMNNTTTTAVFVGPMVELCKKLKISPTKLLMSISFASILGGTCTLIGTSTNIAAAAFWSRNKPEGAEEFGMFEFSLIGLILVLVGIVFMWLVGQHLLKGEHVETVSRKFGVERYLAEIVLLPNSPLIGQQVGESDLSILSFTVLKIRRNGVELSAVSDRFLFAGDELLVRGAVEDLMKVSSIEGIEIKGSYKFQEQDQKGAQRLAEVLVTHRSEIVGRSMVETDFRTAYQLTVLAIYRQGQTLHEELAKARILSGDLLLVQGGASSLDHLQEKDPGLVMLSELATTAKYLKWKGVMVLGVFALAVLASSLGWVQSSVALLTAAFVTVCSGAISVSKAYREIDWRLLILIAGMTAMGAAMENTGASEYLATHLASWLSPFGGYFVLAGFCVLTILLTQPMSNAAAALVVLPVALETAIQLGLNPRTFVMGVMLSASVSLITPFEPSSILVYGPGKYKIIDFVKVGGLLTAILLMVLLALLSWFWPLEA